MKVVRKAWNGGSIERAMEYAKVIRDKMIEQGAALCDECGGEGGTILAGICQQCHGAGCIIPAEGLKLNNSRDGSEGNCTVCGNAHGIWKSIIDANYYACDDCFSKDQCRRLTPGSGPALSRPHQPGGGA